jgi:hypothetical protein
VSNAPVIAILALLVVAFLSMENIGRRPSNAYAEGVSVRAFPDSAATKDNPIIGRKRGA